MFFCNPPFLLFLLFHFNPSFYCYFCLQGIPADDIFADDFEDVVDGERFADDVGVAEKRGDGGARKQGGGGMFDSDVEDLEERGEGEGEGGGFLDELGSKQDGGEGGRGLTVSKQGPKFSEKLVEEYQTPWQPSATPSHLQHRFMVSINSL